MAISSYIYKYKRLGSRSGVNLEVKAQIVKIKLIEKKNLIHGTREQPGEHGEKPPSQTQQPVQHNLAGTFLLGS